MGSFQMRSSKIVSGSVTLVTPSQRGVVFHYIPYLLQRVSIEWTSFFVLVLFRQNYGFITLVVFVCPYCEKPIKIIAAVERTDRGEGVVLQGHPNMVPTL